MSKPHLIAFIIKNSDTIILTTPERERETIDQWFEGDLAKFPSNVERVFVSKDCAIAVDGKIDYVVESEH